MFHKQTPVKITGYGLAAGFKVFYRKIYGFFYSVGCPALAVYPAPSQHPIASMRLTGTNPKDAPPDTESVCVPLQFLEESLLEL